MRRLAQASDVQLHIGESIIPNRGCGFRVHRFAMPRNDGKADLHVKTKFVSRIKPICRVNPFLKKYSDLQKSQITPYP
jgi:hypothetical protein